jgi:ribosomal protein RSM22 (predicted rRNA methylase)
VPAATAPAIQRLILSRRILLALAEYQCPIYNTAGISVTHYWYHLVAPCPSRLRCRVRVGAALSKDFFVISRKHEKVPQVFKINFLLIGS